MSEPENFLSRWSRRKREADAAPQAETPVQPDVPAPADGAPAEATAPAAEEPAFDLASLPSLDDIGAGTDISAFLKPGVPSALRHAALRRAWTSDPAIRDFRGLQENDWDFNAPDGVPGFGSFKSQDEIKALARRLFGDIEPEPDADSQAVLNDSETAPPPGHVTEAISNLDKHQEDAAPVDLPVEAKGTASVPQQDDHAAVQTASPRRHGGALPQ